MEFQRYIIYAERPVGPIQYAPLFAIISKMICHLLLGYGMKVDFVLPRHPTTSFTRFVHGRGHKTTSFTHFVHGREHKTTSFTRFVHGRGHKTTSFTHFVHGRGHKTTSFTGFVHGRRHKTTSFTRFVHGRGHKNEFYLPTNTSLGLKRDSELSIFFG